MTYGVTSAGFVIKPLDVIKAEMEAELKAYRGDAFDVTATSLAGQIIAIVAAKHSEIWELNQAIYNASDPDGANDAALENIAALCPGIIRDPATKSTVTCTCNLDNGTYLAGTLIAHVDGDTTARFVSSEDVTRSGGTGNESVEFEGETAGALVATAGTLTEIAEPVSGWNSVTNAADAVIGDDVETNAALRLRREQQIQLAGSSSVNGIRADVLDLDTVESCVVEENVTDVAAGGLAPHSIRVIYVPVGSEDDAGVAAAILDSKAGGIATNGAQSEVVVDDSGFSHTILLDRATAIPVHFEVFLDDSNSSADRTYIEGLIDTAITEYIDTLAVAETLYQQYIYWAVIDVVGPHDIVVTGIDMDISDPPGNNLTLVPGDDELFTSISANIDKIWA